MKHQQPEIMRLGAEVVINPAGNRVPADVWADLATLILLEPEPSLCRVWVGRIEDKLGVNDQHRQAVAMREERAVESSADKRRRLLDESRRASMLGQPMPDHTLAGAIEQRVTKAAAKRARAAALREEHPKKNRTTAKKLEREADKLDEEVLKLRAQEARHANWGEAREPILMADLRGDALEVKESVTADFALDRYGARIIEDGLPALVYSTGTRAKRLTGIEHAYAAEYLVGGRLRSDTLLRIGQDYREAYIIAEGQSSAGGGEGGGGFGPKAPQPRLVEAGQELDDMRSMLTGRQRSVLDQICGRDARAREIPEAASGGNSLLAVCRALREGLFAAAEGRKVAAARRKELGGESVGARVRAASRVLGRMRT